MPSQHFTEPPPRFSEASLVKALEEYGIGRPSTYASIISTLRDRQYVEIESRRFTATDIGKIVSRFLTQYFTTYVDYDFTAKMEDSLDAVASGEQEWVPLLERFWKPFIELVESHRKLGQPRGSREARDLGTDPVSGKPMSVRMGRFGPFVQIGTKDDADKPKFAGLRPGQKMDTINFEQAIELFKLPRKSGQTAAGEEIVANVGRFGPYVKYGAKYVSLKTDDPYEVSLERALEVIKEKEIADANRLILDFPEDGIQVLNGRYGPYITDKQTQRQDSQGSGSEEPDAWRNARRCSPAAPVRTFGKWGRKKAANAPAAQENLRQGQERRGGLRGGGCPRSAPVQPRRQEIGADAPGRQGQTSRGRQESARDTAPLRPKAKPKAKKSAAKKKS